MSFELILRLLFGRQCWLIFDQEWVCIFSTFCFRTNRVAKLNDQVPRPWKTGPFWTDTKVRTLKVTFVRFGPIIRLKPLAARMALQSLYVMALHFLGSNGTAGLMINWHFRSVVGLWDGVSAWALMYVISRLPTYWAWMLRPSQCFWDGAA